jgi:hypothetical protein
LHGDVALQPDTEHTPLTQACSVAQSAAVKQLTHRPLDPQMGASPEQEVHAPPDAPHAPFAVPGWQVVPSQQPPLQGELAEQAVEHDPALQACPEGQSLAVLQTTQVPNAPHAGVAPEQLVQAPPAIPHAAELVPGSHIEPSQQPPLQGEVPEQDAEHTVALQASFSGQSAAEEQPAEIASEPGVSVLASCTSWSIPESVGTWSTTTSWGPMSTVTS